MKAKKDGWLVVLTTELKYLWLRGQAPLLLLIFSLFMSAYIILLALDPEMNVLSPEKMTNATLQITILSGIVMVVLLNANAISGERDQRSLESLLLTPLPRGEIVIGKLLASLSIWLGRLPISIPYLLLVARGTGVANRVGALLLTTGSLLVAISAGIGMLISSVAHSNLVSFTASFATILLLAAPNQLPPSVKEIPLAKFFIMLNPITAIANYQASILDGATLFAEAFSLLSPIIFLTALALWMPKYFNRRLSLEGGLK